MLHIVSYNSNLSEKFSLIGMFLTLFLDKISRSLLFWTTTLWSCLLIFRNVYQSAHGSIEAYVHADMASVNDRLVRHRVSLTRLSSLSKTIWWRKMTVLTCFDLFPGISVVQFQESFLA